jgi:hypothetical protein
LAFRATAFSSAIRFRSSSASSFFALIAASFSSAIRFRSSSACCFLYSGLSFNFLTFSSASFFSLSFSSSCLSLVASASAFSM